MCKETKDELQKGTELAKQVVEHLYNMGDAENYEVEVEFNEDKYICKCSATKIPFDEASYVIENIDNYHWVEYVDPEDDYPFKVTKDNPIDGEIIAMFTTSEDARLFQKIKKNK